jgi:alcohol dehydrogenase class IV
MLLASARSRACARSFGAAAASQSADWLFPVPTHFGPGRAAELPSLLAGLGASRPLLVTDEALGATPLVARLVASLREAGVAVRVFDEVKANPTDVNVRAGAAAFRAHGADSLVAVGGGSGLDAGKLIAMVANTGLDLLEVEWTVATPAAVAPGAIPPVITVPTTAGTGAEMDSASMCS